MRSQFRVILMLIVLGVPCTSSGAQQEASPETDRDDLDKIELSWPEGSTESADTDAETEQIEGRPLLRIDIPEFQVPVLEQQAAAPTDSQPATDKTYPELTLLIGQLREELRELQHEIRRLRTTVEMLSGRLGRAPMQSSTPHPGWLDPVVPEGGFNPFWLPKR